MSCLSITRQTDFPSVSLLGISIGWLQIKRSSIQKRIRWILKLYRYRKQSHSLGEEIIIKWTKPIPIYCGEGSNMKKVVNYLWIKYNGACRRNKKVKVLIVADQLSLQKPREMIECFPKWFIFSIVFHILWYKYTNLKRHRSIFNLNKKSGSLKRSFKRSRYWLDFSF